MIEVVISFRAVDEDSFARIDPDKLKVAIWTMLFGKCEGASFDVANNRVLELLKVKKID